MLLDPSPRASRHSPRRASDRTLEGSVPGAMEAVARTSTGPASESEAFLGRAGEAGGHRRVVNRPAGDERRRPSDAATPLAAMNGTLRDLCERVRDRLAELSGARPSRRVARVESCLPRSSRLNATSTPARAERSTDACVDAPLHPLARALSSAQAETARLRTSPSSTPRCRRRSTTSTARSSSSASFAARSRMRRRSTPLPSRRTAPRSTARERPSARFESARRARDRSRHIPSLPVAVPRARPAAAARSRASGEAPCVS